MRILLAASLLLLSACASNPYSTFYNGTDNAHQLRAYVPSSEQIRILQSNDIDRDTKQLMVKGYVPIGQSLFNSGDQQINENQVYEQAVKIGAQVVITASKYTNTVSGSAPVTVPNVTQTYSSGTATAYGSSGTVNAYGTGNTTTYGSNTIYVPYSIRRSDFIAVYFVKTRSVIGAYVEPLDDDAKKMLQSNAGVRVTIVIEDSPAFNANIIPGDILTAIDGNPIKSVSNYQDMIQNLPSTTAHFTVYRNGKIIKKNLTPSF